MKKLLTTLAIAAGAMFGASAAQAAVVVSFTPSAQSIAVGGTVSVDVSISGLGAEVLSGYDLNFLWDPAVLGSTAFDFTPACNALGAGAICLNDVSDPGNLGFIGNSLLDDATLAASQADDFLLGTFTFTGLADGATTFSLGADPDYERNFTGLNFETLDVQIGGVCIAVGAGSCEVPEPSSIALVGLALAGAFVPGAIRRRAPKA